MNPLELIDPTIASLEDIDTDQVNEIASSLTAEFLAAYPYPQLESQTGMMAAEAAHLEREAVYNAAHYATTLSSSRIAPREIISVSLSMYLLKRFRPQEFESVAAAQRQRREAEENYERSIAETMAANGGTLSREEIISTLSKLGLEAVGIVEVKQNSESGE